MPDTLEYIEAYFTQALSAEEKKTFEVRCEKDEAFAREVAFYLTARSAARELLMEQKQNAAAVKEVAATGYRQKAPVRKMPLRTWITYAAAACVILFVAVYFVVTSSSPQQLANNYIRENYTELGKTMDTSRDSMQLGIEAYEQKEYERALSFFEGVRRSNPEKADAAKYAGLAYLQTKNYDKALESFEQLSAMKGLYNSGDMLSAVTLLLRDQPQDKSRAKQLLQKVVDEKEEGSEEASEWLKKLK